MTAINTSSERNLLLLLLLVILIRKDTVLVQVTIVVYITIVAAKTTKTTMSDTEGERSEKRYERVDLPPALKNGTNYQEWLRDVEIWQCVTNLPEKKQGPALYRALQGHAKATCSSIAVKDLCEKDGMKILIEKLDKLFAKDKEQLMFEATKKFETFKMKR